MRLKVFLFDLLYRAFPPIKRLVDHRNSLQTQVNSLTGERNVLTGKVNVLTGSVNDLTGRLKLVTGQVNDLIAEKSGPAVKHHKTPELGAGGIPGGKSDAPVHAGVVQRAAKFVVFSNPRSGSTWLETTLGILPDVYVDFEVKWEVDYIPSEIHFILDQDSKSISQLLENMDTDRPVTGSKFVFDTRAFTQTDFHKLADKIGLDVRIIHLTRNYRDVFISVRRGFHHAPSRTEELAPRLRKALDASDFRNAQPSVVQPVEPVTCLAELWAYLNNDLHIRSLQAAGFPYMQVSYERIGETLADIAEFAGSRASRDILADALARPPVAKLPAVEGDRLVTNFAELQPLFETFENLRQRLVVRPGS